MIVRASDRGAIMISGVTFQVLGIIVIAWGFLIPAPLSQQILVALLVTFIMLVVSHLQGAIAFSRTKAEAESWRHTLILRLAIDTAMENAQQGEYAPIDWQQLSQEAIEDIRRAREDDKDSSAGTIAWLVGIPFMIAVTVAYPLIGYGIALLIKPFVPGG